MMSVVSNDAAEDSTQGKNTTVNDSQRSRELGAEIKVFLYKISDRRYHCLRPPH
jgi:hypothetical protein